MLNGMAKPLGGGEALVVDDFVLTAVPETGIAGLTGCSRTAAMRRSLIHTSDYPPFITGHGAISLLRVPPLV